MSDHGALSRKWSIQVIVMPKDGVNDPEGTSILNGLHSLGHASVSEFRAGRLFHIELSAPDRPEAERMADEMASQLLANPVIEQYRLLIEPGAAP